MSQIDMQSLFFCGTLFDRVQALLRRECQCIPKEDQGEGLRITLEISIDKVYAYKCFCDDRE